MFKSHLATGNADTAAPARRRCVRAGLGILVAVVAAAGALWVQQPKSRLMILVDGTELRFKSDSIPRPATGYPNPRTIQLAGEFFIQTPARGETLTLYSRLLKLEVSGQSAFHVIARAKESGEQVEVLSGEVMAYKNYPSPMTTPDHLVGGEMSMVNQTIDLMEKERLTSAERAEVKKGFNLPP